MKDYVRLIGVALLGFAVAFASGCGQDANTADEIAALKKEVASLRAEVQKLSRRSRAEPRVVAKGEKSKPERIHNVRPSQGGNGTRHPIHEELKGMTSEQRKAFFAERRRRAMEHRSPHSSVADKHTPVLQATDDESQR